MDKFLDAYNQPKSNQEAINYLNTPITCNKIEAEIKSLHTKKSPGWEEFMAEFYHTFKEELTPTLFKLFQETERKGTLPNSFYEASITFILKPIKDNQKIKYHIFNDYRCKDSQQNTDKQNSATH
jgi:hypothetical protein